MHNLDYSFPNYSAGGSQQEWEYDGEQSAYSVSNEWEDEYESEYDGEYEGYDGEYESYDGEMEDETALATELLEITNEYELDQFLGKWFKKAKNWAKKSGIYDKVKDGLKSVAKTYLPVAANALGGLVGGPVGSALAGAVTEKGADLLGLELEGLSPEDKEFEVARRFVQFANEAFANVEQEDSSIPDHVAARRAMHRAAQRYAPGLLAPAQEVEKRDYSRSTSGRWVRNGRNLVILNVF